MIVIKGMFTNDAGIFGGLLLLVVMSACRHLLAYPLVLQAVGYLQTKLLSDFGDELLHSRLTDCHMVKAIWVPNVMAPT